MCLFASPSGKGSTHTNLLVGVTPRGENTDKFVSDALTQENYNTVYTATKTCKRAFEAGAGASQSKDLVVARP